MPHVCSALSCAVGCVEEEKMAGPNHGIPIVCMIVCAFGISIPIILKSSVFFVGKLVGCAVRP